MRDWRDLPDEVQFGAWPTEVENDTLSLVSLRFDRGGPWSFPKDGLDLEYDDPLPPALCDLEAIFLSREKKMAVVFEFEEISAFRVLDEHGLIELWQASKEQPRPAQTTFKVSGHAWQKESELSWIMFGCATSYMVATGWACLEVISPNEPNVILKPAKVTEEPKH